jgi:hypothetical protein
MSASNVKTHWEKVYTTKATDQVTFHVDVHVGHHL